VTILQVDSIFAEPGQKLSGYAAVPVGPVQVQVPLLILNGVAPGPRLALTAGVHYGEFVGIEGLLKLFRQCGPAELSGQLVACPIACPPSFDERRSNVCPLDGVNPNRVYPGSATGRPTERLVFWLYDNVIRPSDVFIDLHGGGLSEDLSSFVAYRSSGRPAQDRRAVELAELFGLPIVRGASGKLAYKIALRSPVAVDDRLAVEKDEPRPNRGEGRVR